MAHGNAPPQELQTNQNPSTRYQKPPFKWLVRVVQVTPQTVSTMALALDRLSEITEDTEYLDTWLGLFELNLT